MMGPGVYCVDPERPGWLAAAGDLEPLAGLADELLAVAPLAGLPSPGRRAVRGWCIATAPPVARAPAQPGPGLGLERHPRCGAAGASQASWAGTSCAGRAGAWPWGPAPSGPGWRRSAPPPPDRNRSVAARPAGRPRTRRTPPPWSPRRWG